MTQGELKIALELHKKWLSNKPDGVKLDLSGTNFYGLDLRGMDLSYADLSGVDLSYVDLSRTNLQGTDLSYADLSRTNLQGTDLSYADLSGTNLQGTDLSYADLSGTKLYYANLHNTNLHSTNLSRANTINVIGLDVICVQLNTSDKNRQIQYYVQLRKVTAGCFSGTLDELKKAVREKHDINSVIYKRYQIAFKTIEDILDTY